jgi:hypothetical protein
MTTTPLITLNGYVLNRIDNDDSTHSYSVTLADMLEATSSQDAGAQTWSTYFYDQATGEPFVHSYGLTERYAVGFLRLFMMSGTFS